MKHISFPANQVRIKGLIWQPLPGCSGTLGESVFP